MLDKISSSNNDLNANANPFALDTATDSRWNDAFISRQPRIRLASSSSSGEPGNGDSGLSLDISGNGRFVAYRSEASHLVPNDTNGVADMFVKDVRTDRTIRVSVASDGTQANTGSGGVSISRNGRYVVFASGASTLVPNDTNHAGDIFFHDTKKGTTTRLSVDSNGNQANGDSQGPYISANGRYVTFESQATNLVPDDPNGIISDVFIRDLQTESIKRIPIPVQLNSLPNTTNDVKSISGDGRYVVYQSVFAQGGRGGESTSRVYVYDQKTETSKEILNNRTEVTASISSDGRLIAIDTGSVGNPLLYDQQTGDIKSIPVSQNPFFSMSSLSMSGNGRYLVFSSDDNQLVPDDTNNASDAFVYDIKNQTTKRLTVNAQGIESNSNSPIGPIPSISEDGRFVAFDSDATNLVPNDTNNVRDVFWARNYSA